MTFRGAALLLCLILLRYQGVHGTACEDAGAFCAPKQCCPGFAYSTICDSVAGDVCCVAQPDCQWQAKEKLLALWPAGSFAIPRTAFGCPDSDSMNWHVGRLSIRSIEARNHKRHEGYALSGPVLDELLTIEFCSKLENEMSEVNKKASIKNEWPEGKYCVYKIDVVCPDGLSTKVIEIETRKEDQIEISGINSPFVIKNESLEFHLCCKSSDSKRNENGFGRSNLAYSLISNENECPDVRQKFLKHNYLDIDLRRIQKQKITRSPVILKNSVATVHFCLYGAYDTCYHEEDSGASYRGLVDFTSKGECKHWDNIGGMYWDPQNQQDMRQHLINDIGTSQCRAIRSMTHEPFCITKDGPLENCDIRKCKFPFWKYDLISKDIPVKMNLGDRSDVRKTFDADTASCFPASVNSKPWWQVDMLHIKEVVAIFMVIQERYNPWYLSATVGAGSEDFLTGEALYCIRNVSYVAYEYLAVCKIPIRGQFVTIYNYEFIPENFGYPMLTSLCEVDIYVTQEEFCGDRLGRHDLHFPSQVFASSGDRSYLPLQSDIAWCAEETDSNPWITIDLLKGAMVTAVATQGTHKITGAGSVKAFVLYHGLHRLRLKPYSDNGASMKIFRKENSPHVPEVHPLITQIFMRFIRLDIIQYDISSCMRIAVYGCDSKLDQASLKPSIAPDVSSYGFVYNNPETLTDGLPDTCFTTDTEWYPWITVVLEETFFVEMILMRKSINTFFLSPKMCELSEAYNLNYAGPVNMSADGMECKPWSMLPELETIYWDPLKIPERNFTLAGASCRNFDLTPNSECYVKYNTERPCAVPNCESYNYNVTANVGLNITERMEFCDSVLVSGMAVQFALICHTQIQGSFIRISYPEFTFIHACEIEIFGKKDLPIPTKEPTTESSEGSLDLHCFSDARITLKNISAKYEILASRCLGQQSCRIPNPIPALYQDLIENFSGIALCLIDPNLSCVIEGESWSYVGSVAETRDGIKCQRWDNQLPHRHGNNRDELFPDASIHDAENFCRNPDGEPGPWCYTIDPIVRWDLCDIPICSAQQHNTLVTTGLGSSMLGVGNYLENFDTDNSDNYHISVPEDKFIIVNVSQMRFADPERPKTEVNYQMDPGLCKDELLISYMDIDDSSRVIVVNTPTVAHLPTSNANLTVRTCQRQTPEKYEFNYDHMSIFRTGPSFHLEVTINLSDCPGCGSHECSPLPCTTNCGIIVSPGYPTSVPPIFTRCDWEIYVDKDHYIEITFDDFFIQSPNDINCESSFLAISDVVETIDGGKSYDLIDRFCELKKPPQWVLTKGSRAALQLEISAERTDLSNYKFMASYKGVKYDVKGGASRLTSNHSECPTGWFYTKLSCYKLFRDVNGLAWTDAKQKCSEAGGNLVSINNKDEMLLVHQLTITEDNVGDIYIGLTDPQKSGKWLWDGGSPLSYSNWAPGQPDGGRMELCGIIQMSTSRPDPNWHDVPCAIDYVNTFVCEKQLVSAAPEETIQSGWNIELSCPDDLYTCPGGECIQPSFLCDGVPDCAGTEDESSCVASSFQIQTFTCKSGDVIPLFRRCDFIQDCTDLSDETDCVLANCSMEEFTCSNGQCISILERCNLIPDCVDRSDEISCDECLKDVSFQCYDGTCIPMSRLCDGTVDCPGRQMEDEPEECQTLRYESCKDYAELGTTENGIYSINIPGAGIARVECEFHEDVAVTIFHHNQEYLTYVKGYEDWMEYIVPVTYLNDLDHIKAIKDISESCQQWLKVECVFSQFMGGGAYIEGLVGQRLSYIDKVNDTCECILDAICSPDKNLRNTVWGDGQIRCNCHSDPKWPVSDYGYIREKNFLPVTLITGGDTGNALKEWASHSLGSLECMQRINKNALMMKCKNGDIYHSSERCLASTDTDGLSSICRDSSHLEGCESFTCPNKFEKCKGSYCVPTKVLCDGKHDCPHGEDEAACEMFNCSGLYSCRKSKICIPTSEVCDGFAQCPDKDDELFCDLSCPENCTCKDTSIICTNINSTSLEKLPTLTKYIDLKYNSILFIPDSILSKQFLSILIIKTSFLETIRSYQFITVPNLIHLDLSDNQLYQLPQNAFFGLHQLIDLKLRGNPLTYLEKGAFKGLGSLPILDLSNFHITGISEDLFQGLSSLIDLDISDNDIKILEPKSFEPLRKLKFLNMSGNVIEDYDDDNFLALQSLTFLHSDDYKFCCYVGLTDSDCLPQADQFSSCKDLMSNDILRSFLWIIGLTSFFGNTFVLIWRRLSSQKSSVSSVLVSNLAASDLLMGLYMIAIASVDVYYRGNYIKYADKWRHSVGCQLLGVMSTIASEVSVFVLLIMTLDRFKNIIFPFKGRRLNIRGARIACGIIWCFILILATIPLFPIEYFGGEYYSTSGVCISVYLTNERTPGWQYSVSIFHGMNLVIFVVIIGAYSAIYVTIQNVAKLAGKEKKTDMATARKMALIVFSDFCCWMPLNVMGMLALGDVTIPASIYAVAVVFILPVNSALNPILYTISSIDLKVLKDGKNQSLDGSFSKSFQETSMVMTLREEDNEISLGNYIGRGKLDNPRKIYTIIKQIMRICHQSHKSGVPLINITGNSVYIQEESGNPSVKYIVKWLDETEMVDWVDDIEDAGKLLSMMLQKLSAHRKALMI